MIEKGIRFGNIHSYHDLNLILSKAEIPPASPKTNFIDVSGADGSLDATEVHGEVKFHDRDGAKFIFTMHPSSDLSEQGFEAKKTEVSNALNGMYFERIVLDKDNNYYYSGRCTVDSFLSDKRLRQFVVTARLKPYKMKVEETVVSKVLTSDETEVILTNKRKKVIPEITCTDDNTTVVFEGGTYMFNAGTHQNLGIQLKQGNNTVKVSGSGTIEFKYREGDL